MILLNTGVKLLPTVFTYSVCLDVPMTTQGEAEGALDEVVKEVASEDGVKTVRVEVIHKHESQSSVAVWVIALTVILVLAIGGWYAISNAQDLEGGGTDNPFQCGDGIDNDNGGAIDRDDPDCWHNGQYDSSQKETNGQNDAQPVGAESA